MRFSLTPVFYQYFANAKKEQGVQACPPPSLIVSLFKFRYRGWPPSFSFSPKKVLSLISNTWAGSKALWFFKKANLCTEL